MQVLTCPACTAPLPIPSPRAMAGLRELACAYCGAHNELEAEQRLELEAVSQRVWANEERERKLANKQMAALLNAGKLKRRLLWLMALASAPWLCFGSTALLDVPMPADVGEALVVYGIFLIPPVLMIAMVVWTVRWMGRRTTFLLSACAARPPAVPGEPHACRFCMAPLLASGTTGVVRCEHCETDNVVSIALASRAGSVHGRLTSELGRKVKLASRDLQGAITGMRRWVYFSAFLIPAATFVILAVLLFISFIFERPFDPSREYAVVKTSLGPCIGWVHERDGESLVEFSGDAPPAEYEQSQPLASVTVLERARIAELIGRRVQVEGRGGRIQRAFSTPLFTNWVQVRFDDAPDEPWSNAVNALCLAP